MRRRPCCPFVADAVRLRARAAPRGRPHLPRTDAWLSSSPGTPFQRGATTDARRCSPPPLSALTRALRVRPHGARRSWSCASTRSARFVPARARAELSGRCRPSPPSARARARGRTMARRAGFDTASGDRRPARGHGRLFAPPAGAWCFRVRPSRQRGRRPGAGLAIAAGGRAPAGRPSARRSGWLRRALARALSNPPSLLGERRAVSAAGTWRGRRPAHFARDSGWCGLLSPSAFSSERARLSTASPMSVSFKTRRRLSLACP